MTPDNITDTEKLPVEATVATPRLCDAHGCANAAVEVLEFRDQPGHVHVCGPCGALDREYCDVAASYPLPCPLPHGDGRTWVDIPRALT